MKFSIYLNRRVFVMILLPVNRCTTVVGGTLGEYLRLVFTEGHHTEVELV